MILEKGGAAMTTSKRISAVVRELAGLMSTAIVIALFTALHAGPAPAQTEGAVLGGKNQFIVTGFGFGRYLYSQHEAENSFGAGWTPIILYRVGDSLLFETEAEFELEGTSTEVALEYAQADWLIHENVTIVTGLFLTPFGQFIERVHPVWINRLVSSPLPLDHHASLVPFSQLGVQVRGVLPLPIDPASRVTAAAYTSNGVSIGGGGHDGGVHGGGYNSDMEDTNRNKAYGGRIGVLPVKFLEIGGSFFRGNASQFMTETLEVTLSPSGSEEIEGHSKLVADDLDQQVWGVDLQVRGELWNLRGEYVFQTKEQMEMDPSGALEKEEEETSGAYVEASARLSIIPLGEFTSGYLQPFELAVRYSLLTEHAHTPGADDEEISRLSIGLNYYMADSALLKVGYDINEEEPAEDNNVFGVVLAVGF